MPVLLSSATVAIWGVGRDFVDTGCTLLVLRKLPLGPPTLWSGVGCEDCETPRLISTETEFEG